MPWAKNRADSVVIRFVPPGYADLQMPEGISAMPGSG
jgi:hypothetical protein